ncbi:eukaryotic translation initiation factor 4E-1A-like [Rhopalosiphum maidis]|uniref:eukaryotic translation initiation factor 4E-1A-like n=1 Tax=Rhopalosiphum maidis TaxID=43146 RepID=UPI000EFF1789|nr:eukaryotic translation initiation factor 4E-1A-like [Rhopalosiphum maidis]
MSQELGKNKRMNMTEDKLPKVENKELNETEKAIAKIRLDDKHLLANKWTFWFYEQKSKILEENLQEVFSFDTVEDFWCLFNHIKSPSQLPSQSHYSYFKYGIKPNWDDENNISGGRWLLEFSQKKKFHLVNEYWKKIIMSMIGEVYESFEINGAIISVQNKGIKLSVWTNNASQDNKINIIAIGRKIKEVLGTKDIKMVYECLTSTENKRGSSTKPMFNI